METKVCNLVIVAILANIFAGCSNKTEPQSESTTLKGTISISGAFALYPMAVKWAEEFKKLNPDVKIDISAGGAGKGMTDVLSGMVDVGMLSREIRKEEEEKGAFKIALTKDAVLATVNSNNPVLPEIKQIGIKQQEFYQIYVEKKIGTWKDLYKTCKSQEMMYVYNRSDACGAAEMWALYLGKNQEDLHGVGVYGDPGMADAIKNDKNSIGYNNIVYVYDIDTRKKYEGMEVVPLDLNSNGKIDEDENFYDNLDDLMTAVKNDKYPSPPARDLYFVTKNKPQNEALISFVKWILTDGQKYVTESGYVQLSDEKIKLELQKISN
ncbi:MAG: phosphate ABC transporter substrate-binding protein [Bacteroidetes bacterium GWA2_31_9]|nr:MAG: phosphate ABC transporter substrate-binding protein [Bacteroidetes bacterium GWA2_31_9]